MATKSGKKAVSKKKASDRPVKPHKRKKLPRPRPLPGMEHLRIGALDDLCHEIAENLVTVNEARSNVENLRATAKRLMKAHDKEVWTSSGVTITYVHGEDDVRVRLTSKGKHSADEAPKPIQLSDPHDTAYVPGDDDDPIDREPELHTAGEADEF